MRLYVLLIILFPLSLFAQEDSTTVIKNKNTPAVEIIDLCDNSTEAQFPRGNVALQSYFTDNIRFAECAEYLSSSRVVVKFVVENDGNISDVKILKSICKEQDHIIQDLFRSMPCWIPGTDVHGNPVAQIIYLPITIYLK